MPNYFKYTIIVKSRKLRGVVERHCAALDFAGQMKESDDEQFRESLAKFVRTIGELLNTYPIGEQFGKPGVYDIARIILAKISRIPRQREKVTVILAMGGNEEKELEEKKM